MKLELSGHTPTTNTTTNTAPTTFSVATKRKSVEMKIFGIVGVGVEHSGFHNSMSAIL